MVQKAERLIASITVIVLLTLVVACGGGEKDAGSDAKASGAAEGTEQSSSKADTATFCAGMNDLQSGTVQDPGAVASLYDSIELNAPDEIRSEVEQFVGASRAASDAFAAAGAPAQQVDVDAVISSLTPEQQTIIAALRRSAQTGELADGPAGDVISYSLENCQ